MKGQLELAIIGADGLLGETLLSRLAEQPGLTGQLTLLGGEDSIGQALEFGSQELIVDDISSFDFNQVRVVIHTGDEILDREWLERSRTADCLVLDVGAELLRKFRSASGGGVGESASAVCDQPWRNHQHTGCGDNSVDHVVETHHGESWVCDG